VPSPGATWNRVKSRCDGKWLASAIHGDPVAGAGILCNPLYHGEVIWNRVRWDRGHADSLKRKVTPNPRSAWIEHQVESLRIVPEDLWQRVQARRRARKAEAHAIEFQRPGVLAPVRSTAGRFKKYALSGLLKCAECGASYVISGTNQYACATHVNGGAHACQNDRRVQRTAVESLVADVIRDQLLTPARIELMKRHLAVALAAKTKEADKLDADRKQRLAQLTREIDGYVDAIGQGLLSPTLRSKLEAAESERSHLEAAVAPASPRAVRMLPNAVKRYRELVADLPTAFANDPERARDLLRRLVGSIRMVRQRNDAGRWALWAELEIQPQRLLSLAGLTPSEANSGSGGSGGRI
jgi:site-specific DNA recombinase